MRTVKNPDERKSEILHKAISVFAKKGYDKTSISDIAKDMDISQGLCYRYFASKEEIYDAAIIEYASYIASSNIQIASNPDKTIKEQIKFLSSKMNLLMNSEKDKKDLYDLFHKNGNQKMHDELSLKICEQIVPYVTDILKRAKAKGEINISDPLATAYFCVYGQMGIITCKTMSREEKTERIEKCLLESLNL